MKLSLILLGLSSSLALALPNAKRCECTAAITDKLIFEDSMAEFQASRDKKDPSCCDWSSDGCSSSPDRPVGYDFVPSCQRHDFGYRTSKDQDRFTEEHREKIDDNFKADLYDWCESNDKGAACTKIADIYYAAVRRCGDGNCLDEEE